MSKFKNSSSSSFNAEGRLTQVDYASNAVSSSNTVIAIKARNKCLIVTTFYSNNYLNNLCFNSKMFVINNKTGIIGSGIYTDIRIIINRARRQSKIFKTNFGEDITPRILVKELSSFIQEFTQTGGTRILGICLFVTGIDIDGPSIYQIDSSGCSIKIKGGACGKNSRAILNLIEKRYSDTLGFKDLISLAFTLLQETSDVKIEKSKINVSIVDQIHSFKILSVKDIEKLLNI